MKLCLVYNPRDSKLRPEKVHASFFKDMFCALTDRFESYQVVMGHRDASSIDADVIFFFDPHSSHHVRIKGIEKHPALKIEYWNDLHQRDVRGRYMNTGEFVYKLGAEKRYVRASERGIDYIFTHSKSFFLEMFSGYFKDRTEKMVLDFPHAINLDYYEPVPFENKLHEVLGNGAVNGGWKDGYGFRRWAFQEPYISFVEHYNKDNNAPMGRKYLGFVSKYAGALALCTPFYVAKYIEIPAAGSVVFAEYHKDYEDLGFKDYESCVYVDRGNFEERVRAFLNAPGEYEHIARAGYELVKNNYTARHFADKIYSAAEKHKGEK